MANKAKKASPKEIRNGLIGGAIILVLCCGGVTSFFSDDNAQITPTKSTATTPAAPNNIAELPASPTRDADADRKAAEADRKRQRQEAKEEAERVRAEQRRAEERAEQRRAEEEEEPESRSAYYANCSEARAAGAAPLYRGQPGYRKALDRDGDGDACE